MLGLLAVAFLVVANGFFVATEFAIVAVRRSRLEQLAAEGRASALDAREVVSHLDTYIAACQLGITMASLALGWIGEPAFSSLVEPPLEAIFGQVTHEAASAISAGVSFTLITVLHIVLGELAPKGLALQKTEATVLWVSRPLRLFYAVFRFPVHALNAIGNGVLRLFGMHPASGHEMVHSVEELRLLVEGLQSAGTVDPSEARIASRAFTLGDLTAGQLMTPRTELEAVPVAASRDSVMARAREASHGRWLVYGENLDDPLGVLHLLDLFRILGEPPDAFDIRRLMRPLLVVPSTKPADSLLEELRAARRHVAVVIDEFGGTAGMLTLDDLMQPLVGDIEEEGRLDAVTPEPTSEPGGAPLLDGLMRLDELEEVLQSRLDEHLREEVDTLGGAIMAVLGRVPDVGDEVTLAGRRLRVERLDGRRVDRVRLLPAEVAQVT
jgi:putative hemolysin